MNCADVRHRLLLSERPDKPGPDESRHLAGCPACHAWLRRLVRLERKLTELHVPACPVPAGLLAEIHESDERPLVVRPAPPPSAAVRSVREVGRQKLALASALAATLALFTLAWWQWPPRQDARPVVTGWPEKIDARKRQAPTPGERAEALAGVADEMLADAQARGDDRRYVAQVADEFDGLLQDVGVAAQLAAATDRPRLLGIAERLGRTESAAARLAAEWKARRPDAARSVDQMARAAREAAQRLRQLAPA